jgi:hypothetical protein
VPVPIRARSATSSRSNSPPDPNTFEYYSSPVAILGDTAFVGAPNAVGGGAVFVYTYGDGAWNPMQTLTPDPPGGQFGIGIAIDGDTAVIGANTASIDGNDLQGRAFVFHRTQGTWTQTAMLVADNGTAGDVFGQTVALKGDTALIGAPQVNSVGNQYQGAAYVFRNVEGVWKQVVELTADDGQANDYFSKSLGLASETEAIIGCSGCAVDGVNGHGAAWVFRNLEGSWTQVQKLVPDDPPDGTFFGYSLSVDGAIVLIGAQFAGAANTVDYQGAAYVFTESDGTWSQAQKLFADNGDDGDGFGRAVALSGSTALVGAWGDNGYQGSAYLFKATGGLFAQQTQFIASDGAANDYYGYDVAVSDATALVGAYAKTVDELPYVGQAYFYTTGVPGDTVFRDGFDGAP